MSVKFVNDIAVETGKIELNHTANEIVADGYLDIVSSDTSATDVLDIGTSTNSWKSVGINAATIQFKNGVDADFVNIDPDDGDIILTGGYKVDGGTSSQFLKADGSVDSTTYATGTIPTNNNQLTNGANYITSASIPSIPDNSDYVDLTSTQTIGGTKTFSNNVKFSGTFGNLDTVNDKGMQFEIGTSTTNTLRTDADNFRIYFGGTSGIGQAYNISQTGQHDWDGTSGSNKMRLTGAGDLHVDGDVIAYSTTVSDVSMKDNIKTIENATETVKELRGVSYEWNKGSRKGKSEIGLIAQEVEQVLPDLVHEKEMMNGDTIKTVDYQKMIGLLIESNKELSARLEKLECGCSACDCK
jgi:hypothetical protein